MSNHNDKSGNTLTGTQPTDHETAAAFAQSWNHLPRGSVYTREQFLDWISPVGPMDISGKNILELGCGNASLMAHMLSFEPARIEGVDLGDAVISAKSTLGLTGRDNWKITQADLTTYRGGGFDLVYCIGVLHHLKDPEKGLDAVVRNTKKGGKFHCWVYAREGNALVIRIVDPIRRVTSRLPWWFTKYFAATPLAVPFFLYAKAVSLLRDSGWGKQLIEKLPLYEYCLWIARREFWFFRHVAFDQLVTPQTAYISRETIQRWLESYECVDQESTYILMRNGNSWKFGGSVK